MLLKMAFRNILRQKTRTTFTLIVLAFGYLVMALTMSIAEGSYNNVIKLFTSALLFFQYKYKSQAVKNIAGLKIRY